MIMAEKRNNNYGILVALEGIKKDTEHITRRLDKINGSIEDYQTTKEKLKNVCIDVESLTSVIDKEIRPAITSMKVKFYTAIVTVGIFSGGIGSAIGAAIIRFAGGG